MKPLTEQSRTMSPAAWTVLPRMAWPLLAGLGIAILMQFAVGPSVSGFTSQIMLIAGINIIMAVSLTVVNGFTGQFSMGHAGFMAVGGYVAATLTYYGSIKMFGTADFAGGTISWTGSGENPGSIVGKGDYLFVISCLVGGVVSAIAGYVVGLPSLRLRGDYLAIVTLGFGEIVRVLLQGTNPQIQPWKAQEAAEVPFYKLATMLGGPMGFNLLPTYTTLFWVYLFVVLTLIVCYRLKSSSSGRAFLSIREDEIASQAMGVDVTKYKVRAFVLASFFAGVAGGLYAMSIGAINAGDLGFQKSFDIIIMVVLGGMGSISGATVAAVVLTILPEFLRDPPPVWPLGLAFLVAVVLAQAVRKHWNIRTLAGIAVGTAILEGARLYCVSRGIDIASFRLILYALLLIAMMLLRPQGLLGVREVWELFGHRRPNPNPSPDPKPDAAPPSKGTSKATGNPTSKGGAS
ncbi:MAG TPA: branched-chain amino acid ABC transporter permease [Phycisphaerales bacterium]|nr:branched-chain amino acid ABC transporter permease [Phycisphaerales bacterium]